MMIVRLLLTASLIAALFLSSCSSEQERLLKGKWVLSGPMIGGSPSSFWFKWNSLVVAPWQKSSFAFISEGTYEFVEQDRIRITMHSGHYNGNTYHFRIMSINEEMMVLGSEYEEIQLKRVE